MSQHEKSPYYVPMVQKGRPVSPSRVPSTFLTVYLTKSNLRELDRRNRRAARNSHRSNNHSALGTLEKTFHFASSTDKDLHHYGPQSVKDIKAFARHGGPDLSDLRNFPMPLKRNKKAVIHRRVTGRVSTQKATSASEDAETTTYLPNTKGIGPYNTPFEQHLIDHGIYPFGYKHDRAKEKPSNWLEIVNRLSQRRPSLSPSKFVEESFERFVEDNLRVKREQQVLSSVIPFIQGSSMDTDCVLGAVKFDNLQPLTDGTLVPGNPDIYHGSRPAQLDKRVRVELSEYIIPSTQEDLPLAPNFFLAATGPDGSGRVAHLQACYDGALGARGMRRLQAYGQKETAYENNASTITSTYESGLLRMFTSHYTDPTSAEDRPECFMNQLSGWFMMADLETCRQGLTAYRNAQDWAKEQREEAIRRANEQAGEFQANPLAVNASHMKVNSALHQESGDLPMEPLNTTTPLQESDASSSDDLMSDGPALKRPGEPSKNPSESKRIRLEAGASNHDLCEQSLLPSSGHSELLQPVENQSLNQTHTDSKVTITHSRRPYTY